MPAEAFYGLETMGGIQGLAWIRMYTDIYHGAQSDVPDIDQIRRFAFQEFRKNKAVSQMYQESALFDPADTGIAHNKFRDGCVNKEFSDRCINERL